MLDELFVQLSTRGLQQAMADVTAFRDHLKSAQAQNAQLRASLAVGTSSPFSGDAASVRNYAASVRELADARDRLGKLGDLTLAVDSSAYVRATRDVLDFEAALARVKATNALPTAQHLPVAQRLPAAQRMANPIPVLNRWQPPVATPAAAQQAQRVIPVRVVNAPLLVQLAGGGGRAAALTGGGPGGFAAGATKAASAMDVLRDKVQAFARVAQVGFAAGTAGVLGLARAGFAETVEGYRFGLQMKFLSQQVAALFVPALNKATDLLGQLVEWFRRLDGEGQKNVRNMALLGLGATGLVAMLPKAVGMMTGLAGGAAQLAASLGMSAAAAGPIGVAVAAVAVTLAAWAGLFAVAYARSSELRASVTRLGVVLFDAFAKVKPLVLFLLDAMGRGFAFLIDDMAAKIGFLAKVFVSVWNAAMEQMSAGFLRMAQMLARMAAAAGNPQLKAMIEDLRGAALDIAVGARGLKLDPNAKGGPGGPRNDITPKNIGTESAEQSFQRFQQAVYMTAGKKPEEEAVDQLKVANGHLAVIAGKGEAKQPPPPNAAGGGALNWAV
jgi:hypothetical protein